MTSDTQYARIIASNFQWFEEYISLYNKTAVIASDNYGTYLGDSILHMAAEGDTNASFIITNDGGTKQIHKIVANPTTGNVDNHTLGMQSNHATQSRSFIDVYWRVVDNTGALLFNVSASGDIGIARHATPVSDNFSNFGGASKRWKEIYAATGAINTSDAREKTSVTSPNEALMRAWGKVDFKAFQFADAVEKKGESARIHFGVIAQQVADAFASEGLDASRYALFCYDKWDDEYEDVEVVDVEAVLDEHGNELKPAVTHTEKRLVTPAGDRYGIRYSEALALECAYQRWRLDKLEAKLNG
jgi:hypothetical protein